MTLLRQASLSAGAPWVPCWSDSRRIMPKPKKAWAILSSISGPLMTISPVRSSGHSPATTSRSKSSGAAVVSVRGMGMWCPPR